MRDYARVSPRFWTGHTGKQIRQLGRDAQVLAMYLFSGPSAHMLGLYYLPLPTASHETGIPLPTLRKTLTQLGEVGFALYHEDTEYTFVFEMAQQQILGEEDELDEKDKRVKGIAKEAAKLRDNPLFPFFYRRYQAPLHLPQCSVDAPSEGLTSPLQAPLMPQRSQEKEKDKEQEKEKEQETTTTSPDGDPAAVAVDDVIRSPEELVALYNAERPLECPEVKVLSEERRKAYAKAIKQFPLRSSWLKILDELQASPKLRGLDPSPSHPNFRADLDWLCKCGQDGKENYVKTFEGKYRPRGSPIPIKPTSKIDVIQDMLNASEGETHGNRNGSPPVLSPPNGQLPRVAEKRGA